MLSRNLLAGLFLLALFPVADLFAAAILDQSFTDVTCSRCTSGLGQALDEGFPFGGQTVTAGVTGGLTSVSIFAAQRTGITTPWIIDIVAAPGGVANGTILGVSDPFPLPTEFGWTSVPILSQPVMTAGTVFAIAIQLQGVSTPNPMLLAGTWAGGIYATDPYAGGRPVAGDSLSSLLPQGVFGAGQGDLFFQTFVDTAITPEPGSLAFCIAGFGLIAWRLREPVRR